MSIEFASMHEEFIHCGPSYNHHGSVKYYSPNDLSRICRQSPDSDSIAENLHCKRMKGDGKTKHHRKHHRHRNEISELFYEPTMKRRKEKRKQKKEHTEEMPTYEQFYSMTNHRKDKKKHRRCNKQEIEGFSEMNHIDLQRLMDQCNGDNDTPSNFGIGYYEPKKNLKCGSIDQIPTRDVSSVDKIPKIPENLKIDQRRQAEMKKINHFFNRQYIMSPEAIPLVDAELYKCSPQHTELSDQRKMKRIKGKTKRENESVSQYKTSDSVSLDQMNEVTINTQKANLNKYNYNQWNSEDSIQMLDRYQKFIGGDSRQKSRDFANNDYNQQICIHRCEHRNYGRFPRFTKVKNESERNLITEFVDKARDKKLENDNQNCKIKKECMRKLDNKRDSHDFSSRHRKIDFELNESMENVKNRSQYNTIQYNTYQHHSDHKTNEEKYKNKKRLKKYRNNLQSSHWVDEEIKPIKIHSRKKEHRKHKSRKESIRIKSTNKSRLVNLSIDRAVKMKESIEERFRNDNNHGILDHVNTGFKSESSLSTLHQKNSDLIYLFKNKEPPEQTVKCDTIGSIENCGNVLLCSGKFEKQKYISLNCNDKDEDPTYDIGEIIFPVEHNAHNPDANSMQGRVELFQTAMKRDLSAHPRQNLRLPRYISSGIERKLDTTTDKDEFNNNPNREVHHFDVGTSTIHISIVDEDVDIRKDIPTATKEKISVLHVNNKQSMEEYDETANAYGIIVKGIEPSKKIDTLKVNKMCFSREKEKRNNLECKILSVVAITPENFGNKIEELDRRIMKTMSTPQSPHKDAASQVRNQSSDKRLERLLKYYRVETHPEIEVGNSIENFSSDRISQDNKLFKKLIISKLAEYLKNLQEDNTGEIIEFRTDNPRIVKLVLPLDCLSLECSYDMNFQNVEPVDHTAKESLSDLYINYSDIDDESFDNHQKQIYKKIHTQNSRDNKIKNIIISEHSDVENAAHPTDPQDVLFSNTPTSIRNPTITKGKMVNQENVDILKFEKQPLDINLPDKNMELTKQSLTASTNNQCRTSIEKRFIVMDPLDIENASTFVVSENDQSSAHINYLSISQSSPRDSIGINPSQKADISSKQTKNIQLTQAYASSSKNFSQNLKKESISKIPHIHIENVATVNNLPEGMATLGYFHSQNTSVGADPVSSNEGHTSPIEPKYNESYQIIQEVQEYPENSSDFFSCQRKNGLARNDCLLIKGDYINWINQTTENKNGSMKCSHGCPTGYVTTRKLKQNSQISVQRNEKIYIQKESDKNCEEITHRKYITNRSTSGKINRINYVDLEKKDDFASNLGNNSIHSPRPTALSNNKPEMFLSGKHRESEIDSDETEQNNEREHITSSNQSQPKKQCGELCSETNKRKGTHEERQHFQNKKEDVSELISGEKKLDNCVQKCLNWNIKNTSRTMMEDFPDSDHNKIAGMDKSTQKSSNVPKRSFIPIAKNVIPKSPSGQIRSSSVGRDNNTTLLLTKSYRIPLGQSSYEKRKIYDTSIRKNVKRRSLSESSETTYKLPLVYEVRYFNIHDQCKPPLENQFFWKSVHSDSDIGSSKDLNKDNVHERSYDSISTIPHTFLKDNEYDWNAIKSHDPKQTLGSHHNLYIDTFGNECFNENHAESSISQRNFSLGYIDESRKMKMNNEKKELNYNSNCSEIKSCDHRSRIAVKCSKRIFDDNTKNATLQKKISKIMDNLITVKFGDLMNCNDDSKKCQSLTKLSIKKKDTDLFLFFGNQTLSASKTKSSENFGVKSVSSSSAQGEISNYSDSEDDKTVLDECQLYSASTTTESQETVKAVGTQEKIDHSVIDSGYLTKGPEINYSRTTLDSVRNIEESKLSLSKSDVKIDELVESATPNSKWHQKDLLRLKIQLLFPNVYDDFDLIEAAENTELIKFYIESDNDKLKEAVETISRTKDMSVKSRSVISLPSVKIIPEENDRLKSVGDISSDSSYRMNKGGFYNYQKFIAQNNEQYSSDILAKIKYAENYRDGRETPDDEYPRSESSSMKSSSVYSVRSDSSTKRSIIELFKLKSSKNEMSSSEVNLTDENLTEKGGIEKTNISEEQFCNHFHQIMALECQKFARKVKNQSLVEDNRKKVEEFKEIPLELILKSRNTSIESCINRINSETLPPLIEIDNDQKNDEINELAVPNFKLTNSNQLITDKLYVVNNLQKILRNKNLSINNSNMNFDFHPQENIRTSDFTEVYHISRSLGKSSNISPRSQISEIMPLNSLAKQPEKEFFDYLLTFYDHESEFILKLMRDREFFVSLIDKIRNDEDSFNIIHQKEIQKRCKKEKKQGILSRLFRRKKKSTESLFISPSISRSLEFAESLRTESNSVRRESCYSFYKEIEDFEKVGSEKQPTTMANTEILKKLAHNAKLHLEPMVKATISNKHISDRIKLGGFLKFLEMIEKGDIAFSNNGYNKSIIEAKLKEHVAQLFEKVYRIADREVVQRNILLDDKKIELLKLLVTKYHMGIDIHINILAIYIGRCLIQSKSQLEDAILYLMKVNTDEVNLEEFEQNCGIYQVQQ